MRLFGLIGYPLAQSFSKKYFDAKFEKEGLTDCRFENFPIESVDAVRKMISGNPQLEGLAVTIPHKRSVLSLLDSDAGIPKGLNACNCLRIQNGKLHGYNTDYIGFEKSFAPLLKKHHEKALVLGNGGATEAVVFVLKRLGLSFDIVSRQLHNGSTMVYSNVDKEVIASHQVLINTTPLGMFPSTDQCPPIPYSSISNHHLLFDLVYNPQKTMFLRKGEEQGATIKNGEEMLVIQAEENWKIWNK
jgi:shikimate dehydrogenase